MYRLNGETVCIYSAFFLPQQFSITTQRTYSPVARRLMLRNKKKKTKHVSLKTCLRFCAISQASQKRSKQTTKY